MPRPPCENCDDTGFIDVWINNRFSNTRPCELCNFAWHKTGIKQKPERPQLTQMSLPYQQYVPDPYYKLNLPDRISRSFNTMKGTCFLDDEPNHSEENTWHVKIKVPEGADKFFNLASLPKNKTVTDKSTLQTRVSLTKLFHTIIRRMDYDYPVTKSPAPSVGACGGQSWCGPQIEMLAFDRLSRQLGIPIRIKEYHKAKNCPSCKKG